MNFLEIINNGLLELNYRQVSTFSELVKNDHKKLIEIINIINQEICTSHRWNFLLREGKLTIPPETTEIDNNINGRILYFLIDNKKYRYCEDIEPFLTDRAQNETYSICNNKLLLPKFNTRKTAQIIYYTRNCAISQNGTEKYELSADSDSTLIPMPYAKQLLTYGACLRMKANPSYIRFSYWMSMYKEALANLKSTECIDSGHAAVVKLYRQ